MSLVLSPERTHRRLARPQRAGLPAYAAKAWHERDLDTVVRCVRGTFLAFATGTLLWAVLGALAYGAFVLVAG
jgi:hypothetical protein